MICFIAVYCYKIMLLDICRRRTVFKPFWVYYSTLSIYQDGLIRENSLGKKPSRIVQAVTQYNYSAALHIVNF